tara:strand:+ start:83 stop:517 length:435 start_codon:yes stop_codon:yes gene_type:complete
MKINKKLAFKILLDSIIPPNSKIGIDGASSIDLEKILGNKKYKIISDKFFELILETSNKNNIKDLELLSIENLGVIIQKTKIKNFRFFNEIASIISEFYYLDNKNREALNLKTLPPFPEGNIIEDIDLTILEPVFNRGKIYRKI